MCTEFNECDKKNEFQCQKISDKLERDVKREEKASEISCGKESQQPAHIDVTSDQLSTAIFGGEVHNDGTSGEIESAPSTEPPEGDE